MPLRKELVLAGESWLLHIRDERRLAPTTVATYRTQLIQVFRPLPDDYSPSELRDALHDRLGHHVSAHTRRAAYVTLSLFFRWWANHDGPPSPLRDMEPPPKPRVRRRALSPIELEMLASRLKTSKLKDRCEIMLLLFQGFRTGDVTNLRVEDIDFAGMEIRCRVGKGGRDDVLPLGETVATVLQAYLTYNGITSGYVFTGPNGKMTVQAVWKAWRRVAGPALAGLAPHQLRHSYCTLLLRGESHADIKTVQRLMRHRSLATTELYLDDDSDAERGAILSLDRKLSAM